MAFLESIGYMARAAFVMDRFMHLIGLHGKKLPMCLGFWMQRTISFRGTNSGIEEGQAFNDFFDTFLCLVQGD